MEKRNPAPERHSELHDPKLPVVNGAAAGVPVCPGTVPPVLPPVRPEV